MVFSRGLVISLGVSALSATLLFLYFRSRITSVEKKVDLMFDLIQSHESDRKQMAHQHMMSQQSTPVMQNNSDWSVEQSPEGDLIDVSEDEDEEYDSEDSKEVSDDEDDLEERIKLVTSDIDLEETEEKNIVVLETNNNETITIDDTVELQEVTDDVDQASSGDNENTIQSVTNADEPDELSEVDDSLEDNDTDEEEDVEEEVSQSVEYNKLKVNELKALAEAKGLSNYKSLKKQPLIDLIRASE